MKVVDLAQNIFEEIGSDSNYSIPFIVTWIRVNINELGSIVGICFEILKPSLVISPEVTSQQFVILKYLFLIKYYQDKIIETTGAAANDGIIEISSDGDKVRKVNKNELSKTYLQAKNSVSEDLKSAVNNYKMNNNEPVQVVGANNDGTFDSSAIISDDFNRT